LNRRGQFSIIAALLVAVVLISTVIVTYSVILNNPIQVQPQVLSAIDEINFAIKQILGFTVGYYGSVIKVTGDVSYAHDSTLNYTTSGLNYIASTHPEWGVGFDLTNLTTHTCWYSKTSYSTGSIDVTYNLTKLGIYGVRYSPSCELKVQIADTIASNRTRLIVTKDENEPLINLGKSNFNFFLYAQVNATWDLVNPIKEPSFENGTYVIETPPEIGTQSYVVQVADARGIMVTASSFDHYTYTLNFTSGTLPLPNSTVAVELLQNGKMRWLGQNLNLTPNLKPIIPLPVKSIHVNQTTTNNVTQEVPYQIEDWASNYTIPLGLTNNASIFGGNNMLVFLANPSVVNVTIWWDGSETAIQTPNAYTCKYFTGDSVSAGTFTNGNLTMKVITASNKFTINSTLGGTENTASFMRINSQWAKYFSDTPAFVISHGIVRDIIHQEPEWKDGVNGCPNLYAHIVLTLPANATYYTYQFRLMFVNSNQPRNIYDICLIQLKATIPQGLWGVPWGANQTEDGTLLGVPIVNYTGGFLYNASNIWEHHWSEFIGNNHGFGIMTTTQQNQQLYAMDDIGHVQTGGINITASINGNRQTATIELKPVSLRSVSFTDQHDLIWYGAVATFEGQNPIYPDTGGITGLWTITEYCPTVIVTTST
jgi:hypothetical protein